MVIIKTTKQQNFELKVASHKIDLLNCTVRQWYEWYNRQTVDGLLIDAVYFSDTVNFLGISIVGQSNKGGDGGIYVGSIMKGWVCINVTATDNLFYNLGFKKLD